MNTTSPIELESAGAGRARAQARATSQDLRAGGRRGSFAATLLETVTAGAIQSLLSPHDRFGTMELSVQLLRPLPPDRWLRAEGRVLHMGSNFGLAEAELRDEAGVLLAQATSTGAIRSYRTASTAALNT